MIFPRKGIKYVAENLGETKIRLKLVVAWKRVSSRVPTSEIREHA